MKVTYLKKRSLQYIQVHIIVSHDTVISYLTCKLPSDKKLTEINYHFGNTQIWPNLESYGTFITNVILLDDGCDGRTDVKVEILM